MEENIQPNNTNNTNSGANQSETGANWEIKRPNKPNKKKASAKTWIKRVLIGGAICVLLGFLALIGLYVAVYSGAFGDLPTKSELSAIKNPQASEIYSSDGVLLGKFYRENRTNVKYEDISPFVIGALVATEDARFFKHKGMDFRATMRVIVKTILLRDTSAGGGSTINQQLIKNLYKRERYGLLTIPVLKMKEIIVGRRIDRVFNKKDILTHYLNTVPFGERAFGIGTASQRFFNKKAKDLNIQEAATLVGMLKAPSAYSPRNHPDKCVVRRNTVLNQMDKYSDVLKENLSLEVSTGLVKAAKGFPLELDYMRYTASDGLAPHFRQFIGKEMKKWGKENKRADGSSYNIYTDGLKIYTSIHSKMQKYAQEAVSAHMSTLQNDFINHWSDKDPWFMDPHFVKKAIKQTPRYKAGKKEGRSDSEIESEFKRTYIKMDLLDPQKSGKTMDEKLTTPLDSLKHYLKFLNTGFLVMDHYTGEIKAWVGSVSHEYFPYDHTDARRQVGSTFKPIVYATALERGASPCTFYDNQLRTYIDEWNKEWTPRNSDGEYGGQYSIKGAIAGSVNTVSAQVVYDAGIDSVINLARKMGIENDIPAYPSIALGTPELTLQEMIQVYGSFANGGYKVEPKFLLSIRDAEGRVLEKFASDPQEKERVMDETTAELMVQMLKTVVDSGTARRLRFKYNLHEDFGGKTGTTQSHTDGWFMGITPDLVAGVWTGGSNNHIRFRDIHYGQGANMALPVYGEFFKRLYNDFDFIDLKQAQFNEPPEDLLAMLDCDLWRPFAPIDTIDMEQTEPDIVPDKVIRRGGSVIPRQPSNTTRPSNSNTQKPPSNKRRVIKRKKDKEKKKKGLIRRLFGG